jgi:hypothetical protein
MRLSLGEHLIHQLETVLKVGLVGIPFKFDKFGEGEISIVRE